VSRSRRSPAKRHPIGLDGVLVPLSVIIGSRNEALPPVPVDVVAASDEEPLEATFDGRVLQAETWLSDAAQALSVLAALACASAALWILVAGTSGGLRGLPQLLGSGTFLSFLLWFVVFRARLQLGFAFTPSLVTCFERTWLGRSMRWSEPLAGLRAIELVAQDAAAPPATWQVVTVDDGTDDRASGLVFHFESASYFVRLPAPATARRTLQRALLEHFGLVTAGDRLGAVVDALAHPEAGKAGPGRLVLDVRGRRCLIQPEPRETPTVRVALFAAELRPDHGSWQALCSRALPADAPRRGELADEGWVEGPDRVVWVRGDTSAVAPAGCWTLLAGMALEDLAREASGVTVDVSSVRVAAQCDRLLPVRALATVVRCLGMLLDNAVDPDVAAAAAAAMDQCTVLAIEDTTGAPRCSCCGDVIGPDRPTTVCPHCETPHHTECWRYFGGCTVYACAGGPRRRPG